MLFYGSYFFRAILFFNLSLMILINTETHLANAASIQDTPQKSHTLDATQILKQTHEYWRVEDFKNKSISLQKTKFNDLSSLPNPEISIGRGRGNYSEGTYDELIIRQPIKINGIYSNLKKQQKTNIDIAKLQAKIFKQDLSSKVLQAAYKFKHQLELRDHIQERLDAMNIIMKFVNSKKFFTPKAKLELQLIQNQIEYLKVDIVSIERQLEQSRVEFENYLGTSLESEIQLEVPWFDPQKLTQLKNELIKQPKIISEVFERQIELKKLNKSQAHKSWIPNLGVYYSQTSENLPGGNAFQTLGLSLEVPIFNQGINKIKTAKSELEIESLNQEYEKKYLNINTNVPLTEFKTSIQNLKTYNQNVVDKKDKSFKKIAEDFKKGLVDALSYISIEEQNHKTHQLFLDNRLQSHIALLEYTQVNTLDVNYELWFQ